MSAEACRFVWDNAAAHGVKGNRLLVLLYIACKSKQRSAPFLGEASYRELSEAIGLDERSIKRLVSNLEPLRKLQTGAGGVPNMYAIGHKGVTQRSVRGVAVQPPLLGDSTEVA